MCIARGELGLLGKLKGEGKHAKALIGPCRQGRPTRSPSNAQCLNKKYCKTT